MLRSSLLIFLFVWCTDSFLLYHKFLHMMDNHLNYVNNFNNNFYEWHVPSDQYDFVIVGSSPAGCVLANRLSQNSNWKILLLEAGKMENIFNEIPVVTAYQQSTDYNWGYVAERQNTSCWGMKDQRCTMPRGKGLGGSTLINYMMYVRGNKLDFDRWEEAGNVGWSYDDVLPYFLRSERTTITKFENSSYHNQHGLLNVEFPPYRTQLADAFVNGSRQLGYKKLDYNGKTQLSVSYLQANTLKGQRHTAYKAFIEPVYQFRSNLHIQPYSRATKIIIDPVTKSAKGVEYVTNRKKRSVYATKEVILSAGVFNSPQLLMLSGIGPQEHLKELNIPLIHDAPVGETMYDHITFPGPTFITNSTGQTINYDRLFNVSAVADYFNGQGPLTIPGGVEAVSFMQTKYAESNKLPDIEIIFSTGSFSSDNQGLKTAMRITDKIYNRVYKPLEFVKNDQWTAYIMLFHPKSRGFMKLKDNNPFHWPKIYTNYLKEQEDVERILEGIKEAIRVSQSPAMQAHGSRLHNIALPNCKQFEFGSDEYWRCAIRTLSGSDHHQVGTCKMGPESDPTSVVSSNLTVHGISNLRVVDVSIIPLPITGHTAASAYMIGEKASDLIKADWV